MAYLQSKKTKKNSRARLESKLNLVKLLYQRGYSKEMVIQLFRLIDWLMILPEELKQQFKTELNTYQEEKKMRYVTSIEEIGREEGSIQATRESVIEVLETRFDNVPETITNTLNQINDIQRLKDLLKRAILIESLGNFETLLNSN